MDSQIYLPQSEKLNIGYLSHAFDNKSECYKLFWFQAIIRKVAAGQTEITFDELVDDMIADAWYMVTEYHLNLGPRDNLEAAVNYIYNLRGFRPSEKKEVILDFLQNRKMRDHRLETKRVWITEDVREDRNKKWLNVLLERFNCSTSCGTNKK